MAKHQLRVRIAHGARRVIDRARKQIGHRVVGDLAARHGADHEAELADGGSPKGGVMREEQERILRGGVIGARIALREPVREVPVAWHAAVVRDHVGIPIGGLRTERARVPRGRARVVADVVEDALAVVVGRVELLVGRDARAREQVAKGLPVCGHV